MPSKSWIRQRGCERKVAYETYEEAQAAIRSPGLEVYRCPFKPHWHNGHPSNGKDALRGANDEQAKHDAFQAMKRRGVYPKNRKRRGGTFSGGDRTA